MSNTPSVSYEVDPEMGTAEGFEFIISPHDNENNPNAFHEQLVNHIQSLSTDGKEPRMYVVTELEISSSKIDDECVLHLDTSCLPVDAQLAVPDTSSKLYRVATDMTRTSFNFKYGPNTPRADSHYNLLLPANMIHDIKVDHVSHDIKLHVKLLFLPLNLRKEVGSMYIYHYLHSVKKVLLNAKDVGYNITSTLPTDIAKAHKSTVMRDKVHDHNLFSIIEHAANHYVTEALSIVEHAINRVEVSVSKAFVHVYKTSKHVVAHINDVLKGNVVALKNHIQEIKDSITHS